jgi:hypothetical protein
MDELKQIANYILLHGRYQRNIGLFHGKAGIMLTMFLFSQKTGISVYHDFAEDLFDDVQNQLYDNMPIGMENGLAGIAYAMSYLANKNILSFDQNEILSDIDQKIMSIDPRRISDLDFQAGALGIWFYIEERLKSKEGLMSMDTQYIGELKNTLKKKYTFDASELNLLEKIQQPTFSILEYKKQKLDIDGGGAYYLLKHSLSND